jgi:hypothetical protein
MNREPVVLRPRVKPDPQMREQLEAKLAAVVPPPNAPLHRDIVQPRLAVEWPLSIGRQAG